LISELKCFHVIILRESLLKLRGSSVEEPLLGWKSITLDHTNWLVNELLEAVLHDPEKGLFIFKKT